MEWISDPAIWVGLLTLIALEIVLGVDNLIFIAILSEKLPPEKRRSARIIGLSLALVMRLALLGGITWVMSLTEPLFALWRFSISWRDVILIGGGLFLLVKATTEIHERIEAGSQEKPHGTAHAAFWPIVAQIVVLDAVFSLDSIITAVGMVDHLAVMMVAVIVAVGTMLVAARPLTEFITKRPTLIILCLSFLLMIGLVLVVDGLGLHIPKSYVYTAIAFSVLIEVLNQLAARRRRKPAKGMTRQQVADAVLRLLGGAPLPAYAMAEGQVFGPAEREMVGGVLTLRDRKVGSVMTRRDDVAWLDVKDANPLPTLRENPHREFPVGNGSMDRPVGVVRKEDVLALCVDGKPLRLDAVVRTAPTLRATASVLDAINQFKRHTAELALVVDEQGRLQGILTRTDLLEAIAGDFPDDGE
jgi:predicted tellurium resistance membrane protein TerC